MDFPFNIGDVKVNVSQNSITRADETYVLQPKVLELLVLLCSAQEETLSKHALNSALWPDTVVGPDSLANSMARLRKVLGDDAKNPKFIQTVQRKGYRWLQPVTITKSTSFSFANLPVRSKYAAILFSVLVSVIAVILLSYFLAKNEPKEFLFPDLAIKKLANGGYEIQAGVEGKLTEEKKTAMLKEIKRITGEEGSGMVFTVDPIKPSCEYFNKSDNKNKNKGTVKCEIKTLQKK